jgi:uncharacterized membrane protein/uncharacterized membrane protein YeaQ/YmgE (transglycosylase-associated protein family)
MHVFQWLMTGILVGLIARIALRRSRIGLGGDLALGALGGLLAGALMRYVGVTDAAPGLPHVLVSLVGAFGVIAVFHVAARATLHAGRLIGGALRSNGLADRLAAAGAIERDVFEEFLRRKPVARDLAREQSETETLGQRAADRVAGFGGSWAFIGLFAAVLVTWMLYNVEHNKPFDPYPFILLNLVLSCIAAVQAPIILMSQNRQGEKDRIHAQADYVVNLKAELEILALHTKIDELRDKAWRDLIDQQERQLALLEQLATSKR